MQGTPLVVVLAPARGAVTPVVGHRNPCIEATDVRPAVAMQIHQQTLTVHTRGRGPSNITAELNRMVRASGIRAGLCTVFIQHTSAGLVIQENADPAVLDDLASWLSHVAPESASWQHDTEGPDDMPAHLRAVLTRTTEVIPICAGQLGLGTWQGVYLWEHRTHPHARQLVVTMVG